MRPPVKPIRDLFFRFIESTAFEGRIDGQGLAALMANAGLIELIPHRSRPTIEHYRVNADFSALDRVAQLTLVYKLLSERADGAGGADGAGNK